MGDNWFYQDEFLLAEGSHNYKDLLSARVSIFDTLFLIRLRKDTILIKQNDILIPHPWLSKTEKT